MKSILALQKNVTGIGLMESHNALISRNISLVTQKIYTLPCLFDAPISADHVNGVWLVIRY